MMTIFYSCRCNSTMMMKNYKIDYTIEFLLPISQSHKPLKSHKSILSPFLSENLVFSVHTHAQDIPFV